MAIQQYPAATTGATTLSNRVQVFNSSSTWTAPAGVTSVNVAMVGGGGGGGYAMQSTTSGSTSNAGGGGGGGGVVRGTVSVTPGTTYTVTVGAGGAGGSGTTTSPVVSQSGGYSSFGYSATLINGCIGGAAEFGQQSGVFYVSGSSGSSGFTSPPSISLTNSSPNNSNYGSGTVNTISGISIGTSTPAWTYGSIYQPGFSTPDFGDIYYLVPVTAGTTYTASAYFNMDNINGITTQIMIQWLDSFRGSVVSTSSSGTQFYSGSTTVWNQRTLTATAPGGSTWALIRNQVTVNSSSGSPRLTGLQFEVGSSATSYKNYRTSGARLIRGAGIVNNVVGLIAQGGGAGQNIMDSSGAVGGDFGGGGASFLSATSNWAMLAGHGASRGTGPDEHQPFMVWYGGSTAASAEITVTNAFTSMVSEFGQGSSGVRSNAQRAFIKPGNGGAPTAEGWGAGGLGGVNGQLNVIIGLPKPGYGAGDARVWTASSGYYDYNGVAGLANTGAGGGGGASYSNSTIVNQRQALGGNGGSGQVILSWVQ